MSEYKLVPFEPTDEMGIAGCEAVSEMPNNTWLDHDEAVACFKAMLAAAPAGQGEPVDWKDGYRAAMNEAGWAVRELYVNHVHHTGVDGLLKRCQELEQSFICSAEAAPQPVEQQPDVAQLVEALEDCITALEPYDDIKPRDWKTDRENLRRAHQSARAALAAYRKQGGE